jgi:antimicrobial peptide system SdpA family protein
MSHPDRSGGRRPAGEPRPPARLAFAVALAVVSGFLALTIAASWQSSVLTESTDTEARRSLQVLVPQGWAFFTKSPEGASLIPYQETPAGWRRADSLPQSSSSNLFGLSRNQRSQGTELAIIAAAVPSFTKCNDYRTTCPSRPAGDVVGITNDTNTKAFCGRFKLVLQEPVKWAYRNRVPESLRVTRQADVDVRCD